MLLETRRCRSLKLVLPFEFCYMRMRSRLEKPYRDESGKQSLCPDGDADRQQNLISCSACHCQPSMKMSRQSVRKFLHKVANNQTNRQTNNADDITLKNIRGYYRTLAHTRTSISLHCNQCLVDETEQIRHRDNKIGLSDRSTIITADWQWQLLKRFRNFTNFITML